MVAQRERTEAVEKREGAVTPAGMCPRCKMGRIVNLFQDEAHCYICSYTVYSDSPRMERGDEADSHFQGNLHVMRYVGHASDFKDQTITMLVKCEREDLDVLAAQGRREAHDVYVDVDCPFCGLRMSEKQMWGNAKKRREWWRLVCAEGHMIHARKTMDGWL